MSEEKVFMGYDVVDVAAFARRADEFRAAAKKSFGLGPSHKASAQFSVFSVQQEEKAEEVRTLSSQRSQSRGSKEQDRPEAEHLSTLNPKPSTEQSLRSAYGLPARYFLNLGRFVEKKNLATLVSAYARYAGGVAVAGKKLKVKGEKQGAGSMEHGARETAAGGDAAATSKTRHSAYATRHRPASLVLVGEGPLRGDLEGQARALGLAVRDAVADRNPSGGPEVVFYPFQQADLTPLFFARSEAFVLPSMREEWGLVVNEAMACSVPVLVSNCVGAHFDLVEEGVNGFTFEPMDVAGLAELLGRFDAEDGLSDRFGAAGCRRIKEWSPERFGRAGLQALKAASAPST
jgi:glycosyltransferase involved in cell wall biosynthesis